MHTKGWLSRWGGEIQLLSVHHLCAWGQILSIINPKERNFRDTHWMGSRLFSRCPSNFKTHQCNLISKSCQLLWWTLGLWWVKTYGQGRHYTWGSCCIGIPCNVLMVLVLLKPPSDPRITQHFIPCTLLFFLTESSRLTHNIVQHFQQYYAIQGTHYSTELVFSITLNWGMLLNY